ncbi:GNAT family N-acetyltransferase [Rhizobium sp.]|uniref:GNAT family N-acetyltransferase n=1 Tax=Rhizobium sp. TaxID=391 RepID=UPI000E9D8B75|nr:siderophore biosynthesis protein [Rhizobium sp.]
MDFGPTRHAHLPVLKASKRREPHSFQIETRFGQHELACKIEADAAQVAFLHGDPARSGELLLAAAEAVTAQDRSIRSIDFGESGTVLAPALLDEAGKLDVTALWQWPVAWTHGPAFPAPKVQVMSSGRYHPRRPRKPQGEVYRRFIPWLGEEIAFRVAQPDADLADFHRWMNDEQVRTIWEDDGDIGKHRDILNERAADPHVLPLIGTFGDVPFGYFEVYWAKENRLGPFYDADDYDRGWHVAIGEPAYRGKAWISAWLPSLMHFIFLDDPRTQRIVGEPRASHEQQIRNLDRSGFAKIKHFNFPHKRALLVMLMRERFFDDHLWVPAS